MEKADSGMRWSRRFTEEVEGPAEQAESLTVHAAARTAAREEQLATA
jgi:hypothetical protein